MKRFKIVAAIIFIPIVVVAGYFIMEALMRILPMESLLGSSLILMLIILIGLAVPYWIIKAGFFAAHLNNRNEKNIHLDDLPKDADRIARTHHRHRHV